LLGALALSLASYAGDSRKEAPMTTATLASQLDGAKWSFSSGELVKLYNSVGGRFDQDYDALLAKAQPGVQQKAIEFDRDTRKRAFEASRVEFKDTPTGYDSTPIRPEYTYKNRESIMSLERQGSRTYFFFFGQYPGDRLWKIYREVRLSEGGPYGNTFQECVTKLNTQVGVAGRIRAADATNGLSTTEVDWQDAETHLRALDRSRDRVCGIVYEQRATLVNLASLRATKDTDPFALDPSIANVTKGGVSDPSSRSKPAGSSSAAPK
jgi:hypothetical protein